MSEPVQSIEQRIAATLEADAEEIPGGQDAGNVQGGVSGNNVSGEDAGLESPTVGTENDAERPAGAEGPGAVDAEAGGESDTAVVATDGEGAADEYLEIGDPEALAAWMSEQIDAEVPVSEIYNLAIPYTKNGEKHEFTLGEVKDKLQDFEDTIALRDQLESRNKQITEREAQYQQDFEQRVTETANFLQRAEQMLLAEMQSINWAELERTNPGEWARLSETYRRKQQEIAGMKQEAGQAFSAEQKQAAERRAGEMQEVLQREQQALLRVIPEWRNEATAEAERSQLVEYMREKGYTADEINNLVDHRFVALARDAMLHQKGTQAGEVAAKKVVKIAKRVVKPGGRRDAKQTAADREQGLVKAHRANPKSVDAAAARIQLKLGR